MTNTTDGVVEVQRNLAGLVAAGRLTRRQSEALLRALRRAMEVAARHRSSLAAFVDGVLMALDRGSLAEGSHFRRLPNGSLALALRDTWAVVSKSLTTPAQQAAARRFLREPAALELGVVGYQARARFGAGHRRRVLLLNVDVARRALNRPAVPV